jgi:hypothetical protein
MKKIGGKIWEKIRSIQQLGTGNEKCANSEATAHTIILKRLFKSLGLCANGQTAFTLQTLAGQFAGTAYGFCLLAGAFFGGFFKMDVTLHFTE